MHHFIEHLGGRIVIAVVLFFVYRWLRRRF